MATTPVHARLRIGGTLYGDASWSVGCNFLDSDGNDPFNHGTLDVQQALESWRDAVVALNSGSIIPGTLQTALSGDGSIDWVRCSRIGTDGKESAVALIELNPIVKGTGTGQHDAQTACVVSLQTGRPGASYRGRMYWPAIGLPLTNGRLNAGGSQGMATNAASWLNQVGDAALAFLTLHAQPAVVSTTKGVGTVVGSVRVGNRLDSQRRRAEGQDELYSSAVVPN